MLCSRDVAIDHPSRLAREFLDAAAGRTVYLHAMHSVVVWFAYAIWREGRLERALSLPPDSGILENVGTPRSFEAPCWAKEDRSKANRAKRSTPSHFIPPTWRRRRFARCSASISKASCWTTTRTGSAASCRASRSDSAPVDACHDGIRCGGAHRSTRGCSACYPSLAPVVGRRLP